MLNRYMSSAYFMIRGYSSISSTTVFYLFSTPSTLPESEVFGTASTRSTASSEGQNSTSTSRMITAEILRVLAGSTSGTEVYAVPELSNTEPPTFFFFFPHTSTFQLLDKSW